MQRWVGAAQDVLHNYSILLHDSQNSRSVFYVRCFKLKTEKVSSLMLKSGIFEHETWNTQTFNIKHEQ